MRIRFDGVEILVDEGVVNTTWGRVNLRPTEFRLLVKLASVPDRVHRREDLIRSVWHSYPRNGSRTVDMHVSRLRSMLGPAGAAIHTVRGVGYRFDPERLAAALSSAREIRPGDV
jgi:DNA-binding response OmpR family regulator